MKIEDTFDYVEDYPGFDQTLIRLNEKSPFGGVIFHFGTVRLDEQKGDQLKVNFDYKVIEKPIEIDAADKPVFEKTITDILHYLLVNRNTIT